METTTKREGFSKPRWPRGTLTDTVKASETSHFLAEIPFLTIGIVGVLYIVFLIERHFAFDIGKKSSISTESLLAFGAVGYDLVVRSGEVWRVFLAPLLHKDAFHLFGNCFALLFVGARLEPMIGRGWFAAIFAISALGGVVGSLLGNPAEMVSVGASGAITGVIGALFAMSFHDGADGDRRKAMRRTALRFGLPALLPLAIGASTGVDHHAHLGGFFAGCTMGLVLSAFWSGTSPRPALAKVAGVLALGSFMISLLSGAIASTRYKSYAADARQLIPQTALPTSNKDAVDKARELVEQYPNDPRAHLLRAISYLNSKQLSGAESEFRRVLVIVPDAPGSVYRPMRYAAQTYLAMTLAGERRLDEAREMSRDICGAKDQAASRALLVKAKLCN